MSETFVLCGGVAPPRRAGRVIHLSAVGNDANITLRSDDIGRKMLASAPGVVADLIDIATYVYGADQLVSRGGPSARNMGADWRRVLNFVIPVREPGRWTAPEVSRSLERLLAFMSDDDMRFQFVPRNGADRSEYLDLETRSDEVALFSGGLDSLAGAVDHLSKQKGRLLLVSHQSSTKIAMRQRELSRELNTRFPGRVVHIPVRITMRGLDAVERTQRTRTFLFGALAAAVAQISGTNRISVFENGIVSLNLPIAAQIVGTAATRTTHPRVLANLSRFLATLCERSVSVENPFLWMTKTEVAAVLRASGSADLARHTVSCSRVHWMTTLHTHCECCSQCLDRRFGAMAARLNSHDPAEMYEVDLLTGARANDLDRTMAESFVRHALELHDMGERAFMDRFGGEIARAASCVPGMTADDAARAMLHLHQRHAAAVRSVLEEGYRQYAAALTGQTLPPSCLLRIVAGPAGVAVPPIPAAEVIQPAGPDARDFLRSSQIRIAVDEQADQILIEGFASLEGRVAFPLIRKLVEIAKQDAAAGRAPEHHTFVRAASLAASLSLAEPALRACVRRIRNQLAKDFEDTAGLSISRRALIENVPWKGYRLNPAVLILAVSEVTSNRPRHDSSRRSSQVPAHPPTRNPTLVWKRVTTFFGWNHISRQRTARTYGA